MKENLLLFTTSFPYGSGEQFLETEIKYLNESFQNVYILPTQNHGLKRDINSNIKVIDEFSNLLKSNKYYKILYVLFQLEFWRNFKLEINYIKFLFVHVYHMKKLIPFVEAYFKNNNLKFGSFCFYTYWFNEHTTAVTTLKQQHNEIYSITRAHGSDMYESVHNIKSFPFREMVLENINKIYSISIHGKKHISDKYPQVNNKVAVQKLGVENKAPFIKEQSNINNGISFFSCSSLIPLKRVHLIIEVLSKFKNLPYKLKWVHIGDGPLLKKLEAEAKEKIIDKNIEFTFLGSIKNKEVFKIIEDNKFDFFINVSESEGIPVSIMEAQSFGIPVIATNVGGVSEIVNEKNGYLIDKDFAVEELFEIINSIKSNKEFFLQKRINSYNNWNENYNAAKNYASFISSIFN